MSELDTIGKSRVVKSHDIHLDVIKQQRSVAEIC